MAHGADSSSNATAPVEVVLGEQAARGEPEIARVLHDGVADGLAGFVPDLGQMCLSGGSVVLQRRGHTKRGGGCQGQSRDFHGGGGCGGGESDAEKILGLLSSPGGAWCGTSQR